MNEPRLLWEPLNKVPLPEIENRFSAYVKGRSSGVSVLGNATLLFLKDEGDHERQARRAMEEARFLTGFEVDELREGGFLVVFHPGVAVFVGAEEFNEVKAEIRRRIDELHFPSESFQADLDDKFLIGLYGRGKLQRDVFDFSFHRYIRP
jgi:hypothetical protein